MELFARRGEGEWSATVFDEETDIISLRSLDCELTLAEIYEKVVFG